MKALSWLRGTVTAGSSQLAVPRPTPHWAWSWVIAAVSIFGLYISGQWLPWGWLVGSGLQLVWIGYGFKTKQYGFLFSAAVFAVVSYLNFRHAVEHHNT